MSATIAPRAAPSHAMLCWLDDSYIYVELPTTFGQPYVEKFELCDNGLHKALNLLRNRYMELPSAMKNYTIPPPPISTKNGKPPIQTDAQRDHALSVLRKLGIV